MSTVDLGPTPAPPTGVARSEPESVASDQAADVVAQLVAASATPPVAPSRRPIDLQWVARLPADTLFHLAAIAKHYDRREFKDPKAAAEELAEMLSKGQRPALGWYRRHLAPREWPPTYQPTERPPSPGLGD